MSSGGSPSSRRSFSLFSSPAPPSYASAHSSPNAGASPAPADVALSFADYSLSGRRRNSAVITPAMQSISSVEAVAMGTKQDVHQRRPSHSIIEGISPDSNLPSYTPAGAEAEKSVPPIVGMPSDAEPPAWITARDIAKLGNLPYLNGMRALASVMIEIAHITPDGAPYVNYFGFFALTTHFVQGAFLITGSLLALQERSLKSQRNNLVGARAGIVSKVRALYSHLWSFFLARWARLYPALILLLAVTGLWWNARHQQPMHLTKLVVRSLFKFTQFKSFLYVSDDEPPNPFANLWFLDVQEHFYISWALLLPLVVPFKTPGRILILTVLFVLSYRKRLNVDMYNATLPINVYKMVIGCAMQLVPIPRAFVMQYASRAALLFCLGCFVWGFSPRFSDAFTEKQHRTYGDNMGIIAVLLVTLAAIAKAISRAEAANARSGQQKGAADSAIVEDQDEKSWFTQRVEKLVGPDWTPLDLLDSQMFSFIGRISYSWYLWQVPLMHYEGRFRSGYYSIGPTAEAFVISIVSTIYVEEPIRNMYVAYRKKQRNQAAATEAALATATQLQQQPHLGVPTPNSDANMHLAHHVVRFPAIPPHSKASHKE